MMNTKTFSFLLILIFASSCAFHSGLTSAGSAAITDENFSIISLAQGTSKTVKVFGIGSTRKDAMVLEAKKDMYLSNPLAPGQAFGSMTVDFKRSFYFLVSMTEVTVSAEVVDFTVKAGQSFDLNKNLFGDIDLPDQYKIGDQVYFIAEGDTIKSTIAGLSDDKIIVTHSDNEKQINRLADTSDLFVFRKPIDPHSPNALYTPQNPTRKLVKFHHMGQLLEGELLEEEDDVYLIKMETGDGKNIGLYVESKYVQLE